MGVEGCNYHTVVFDSTNDMAIRRGILLSRSGSPGVGRIHPRLVAAPQVLMSSTRKQQTNNPYYRRIQESKQLVSIVPPGFGKIASLFQHKSHENRPFTSRPPPTDDWWLWHPTRRVRQETAIGLERRAFTSPTNQFISQRYPANGDSGSSS